VPTNVTPKPAFPARGVPGGWRDWWDEPLDHAALRVEAEAAERRLLSAALVLGAAWQGEIRAERRRAGRQHLYAARHQR
jgi:hypothetical protein